MAMLVTLGSMPLVIFPEFIISRKTHTVIPLCCTASWEKKSSSSTQLNSMLIAMHIFLRRYSTCEGKSRGPHTDNINMYACILSVALKGRRTNRDDKCLSSLFCLERSASFCTFWVQNEDVVALLAAPGNQTVGQKLPVLWSWCKTALPLRM